MEDRNNNTPDTKTTILAVDDERINLIILNELLKNSNYEIIYAKNGKEAVEMCLANPEISLVLMDIKMPVMDGIEATRHIKSVRPELPVIMQTAFIQSTNRDMSFDAGCSDFLEKPLSKDLLINVITKYISVI